MIRTISLPSTDYVARLLGGLLDREVTAAKDDDAGPSPQQAGLVALYAQDDGAVAALCVCDLDLAARAGAALTLVPADNALEAVKQGYLPDSIEENAHEILNVAARLFNSPRSPHVALRGVHRLPGMLPADARGLLSAPAGRLGVQVEIEGYGSGHLWLLTS